MLRCRLTLTIAVLAWAVGACAAESASATSVGQWIVAESEFSGSESVEATASGSVTLALEISKAKVVLTCTAAKATGSITEDSNDTSTGVTLSGCSVKEPSGCKTTATLKTVELKSELIVESEKVYDLYEPKSGTTLTTIEISGCSFEGEYSITGSLRCEPGAEAVETTCDFGASSGSKLKFGANEATFTGNFGYRLTGANKGQKWAAQIAVLLLKIKPESMKLEFKGGKFLPIVLENVGNVQITFKNGAPVMGKPGLIGINPGKFAVNAVAGAEKCAEKLGAGKTCRVEIESKAAAGEAGTYRLEFGNAVKTFVAVVELEA